MQPKEHWERIYSTKVPENVGWFQEHAYQSLRLIQESGVPRTAKIIDVGGDCKFFCVNGCLSQCYAVAVNNHKLAHGWLPVLDWHGPLF